MAFVMLVEDDIIIREAIKMLLQTEGYDIKEAGNGRDALTGLKDGDALPCMILLDLMMPIMSGVEFRRRQLQDPEIADVPVAIMTGRSSIEEMGELRPLAVFRKPFHYDELMHLVAKHCS